MPEFAVRDTFGVTTASTASLQPSLSESKSKEFLIPSPSVSIKTRGWRRLLLIEFIQS